MYEPFKHFDFQRAAVFALLSVVLAFASFVSYFHGVHQGDVAFQQVLSSIGAAMMMIGAFICLVRAVAHLEQYAIEMHAIEMSDSRHSSGRA